MNNQKFNRGVGLIYRYHKLNHPLQVLEINAENICASTEIELSNWIVEKPVKKISQ